MDLKNFWPDFSSVNTLPPKSQYDVLDLSVLTDRGERGNTSHHHPPPQTASYHTPHRTTTMSCGCNAGRTRSTTLVAEEDAAAAGTRMDNATLVKLLMGEFTNDEDDDPTPTAAEPMVAVWPDEKHIKSAISAVENPYLVVPHPKNANHQKPSYVYTFFTSTLKEITSTIPVLGFDT